MAQLRRVLEIGHGGDPMGNSRNGNIRRFSKGMPPDTVYHGVDNPEGCGSGKDGIFGNIIRIATVADAEASYRECKPKPKNVFLYRMDGRHLAFGDGIFEEVHLHNMVHDPRIPHQTVRSMLSEAYRVLVPGGTLVLTAMGGAMYEHFIPIAGLFVQEAGFKNLPGTDLFDATAFGPMIDAGYQKMDYFTIIAKK